MPATAVSGVYIAHLNAATENRPITFVVRDDASTSDVVFQTSDTTWQAYNTYGGNSLYTVRRRARRATRGVQGAYKVTYNRPFNTAGTTADFVFFGTPSTR